jgi:predicted ATPase
MKIGSNYMSKMKKQEGRMSPERTAKRLRVLTAEDVLRLEAVENGSERHVPFQELVVEGLLSFGERTSFEFGWLNILVGPNGSGKSNLIDCIRVFHAAPYDIQDAFKDSGFEDWLFKDPKNQSGSAFLQLTAKMPELPVKIRHQIKLGPPINSRAATEEVVSSPEAGDGQTERYFIGSHRSGAFLSTLGVGKRRRERGLREGEYDPFQSILSQVRDIGQYPEITRLSRFYADLRIYSEWTFGRNSNLREATPASRSSTMLSESMNDLPLALNGIEKTAAHDKIRVLLRELKETYRDYVTRVLFGRVGLELVEAPFALGLPAKRLSDGTLRFLALAAILLQPAPPPLVCLEEPELGMHPDMIRMVAGMIIDASAKTQIIITTHSEHLLTALQDDFDALFAFGAGLAGTVVRRFSREEYKGWREEHTLGELWTSGELGGNRW